MHLHARGRVDELDDRHLGLPDHLDVVDLTMVFTILAPKRSIAHKARRNKRRERRRRCARREGEGGEGRLGGPFEETYDPDLKFGTTTFVREK